MHRSLLKIKWKKSFLLKISGIIYLKNNLLKDLITQHKVEATARLQKLEKAYENQYQIYDMPKKAEYKPDNRLSVNFAKYIVDTMTGFFSGVPFAEAFAATDASVGLPWGSMIALLFTFLYFFARRLLGFKQAMGCITKGFIAMVPALLILTFAVTLKNITGILGAADYVYGVMDRASAGLYKLLPAIIFLVACGLAFSTGTSWGTFGILLPIVTKVFPADSTLLIIGVSACLAGAVMGDHCSPISDTSIMASAGAQCDHINHISTQLPYVLTVAAVSFVNYLIAGFVQNVWLCLGTGLLLTVGVLFLLRRLTARA